MLYRQFRDTYLSCLGLGCMRLPVIGSDNAKIDEPAAEEMIDYAIKAGVNYFDTAYGYHLGNSEKVVGKILEKYPREDFYLASKFPGYDVTNIAPEKIAPIFEEQLEKCRTPYFDFYLFHNVYEKNVELYLDEKNGVLEYLLKQKELGRIRHLGFSVHGSSEIMRRFLEVTAKQIEFVQIQLNYIDYEFQKANEKIDIAREYGIPIWVMEPLRGGKLAQLPENAASRLKELRPNEKPLNWAFRYMQTIPEVCVTLSGMSNLDQLKENIKIFEENKPLSMAELDALYDVARELLSKDTLPCTACRYCTSGCPMELDIPGLILLYNEHMFTGGGFIAPFAVEAMPREKRPSACIACKSCEALCPQQIEISKAMADFSQKLGGRCE